MSFPDWRAAGNPVDIDCWRKVQGLDVDSRVYSSIKAVKIASREMSAVLTFPAEVADFKVSPVEGMDIDYGGKAYPLDGSLVVPGPFQDMDFSVSQIYRALHPYIRKAPPKFLK